MEATKSVCATLTRFSVVLNFATLGNCSSKRPPFFSSNSNLRQIGQSAQSSGIPIIVIPYVVISSESRTKSKSSRFQSDLRDLLTIRKARGRFLEKRSKVIGLFPSDSAFTSIPSYPAATQEMSVKAKIGRESETGRRDAFSLENANIPGNHSRRRASLRWLQAENRNQRRSSSLMSRRTLYPSAKIA
ncbi:hypothetical protein K0M31_014472 [Melipona bicolor]|uniref:Uncharacterized protein n=1 Tax=Melipona bicolor TaxID=60889 RepID=A0AA40G8N8_9HYME|nr:hypothetical protein K0M31_014472 [Melipona bicolor]